MMRIFFTSLIIPLLFASCEKNNIRVIPDSPYPTIIYKLSGEKLIQLRAEFSARNLYTVTSVSEFGFCNFTEESVSPLYSSQDTTVTDSQAVEIAKSFISNNSEFTGIVNIRDAEFSTVQKIKNLNFHESANGWHLETTEQRIDTIDIPGTRLHINIRGREVYSCVGNWYPYIYIPDKFMYDEAAAKAGLLNTRVKHITFAGQPYYETITAESLEKSTVRLIIWPLRMEDRIELHVTWEIELPAPVYYKIFIDVMTGKIIEQSPTIIS